MEGWVMRSQRKASPRMPRPIISRGLRGLLLPGWRTGSGSSSRKVPGFGRLDGVHEGLHPESHGPVVVSGLDARDDGLPDDPRRDGIGDLVLESVPHLDPDLFVLGEEEEDEAVVQLLPPHLPFGEGLDGPVFGGGVPRGRPDPDEDLMARATLVGLEPLVQAVPRALSREESRRIGHPPRGGRRYRHLCSTQACRSQEPQGQK